MIDNREKYLDAHEGKPRTSGGSFGIEPSDPTNADDGDIGLVADVDPGAGELTARFEGRDLVYGFGELDTLVPAYAATVHKSQGSEYPAVVIPVLTQHYAMLKRNLLYTGVTRGKRLVVLVGPEEGGRHRRAQRLGTSALVEAGRGG